MAAPTYRTKTQIKILGSIDEAEQLVGFERSSDSTTRVIRIDLTESHNETRLVAASVVDEALAFGGVASAKVLYMETDQELTIKINGGTESFKLSPTTGAKAKLFWDGEFTSITVTNASLTDGATFTYMIAG